MVEKMMLFTPGPVMTSDRVKAALAHPDMGHRRPTFEHVLANVRAGLLELFRADGQYATAVVSGSGTAANETALSSIVREGDEVLLIKNGEFGNRLEEILTCYHYPLHVLEYAWGQPPDPQEVERRLIENAKIAWVCIVYHETSTSMINPVGPVSALVHKHGRKLFVDCISAVGGEEIDVVRDQIDVATGVPNKAVGGMCGVSFVCARRSSVPALGPDVPRRNIYLNLQNHIQWADRFSQTPNTPSVTMFVALDATLQELLDEGLEARIQRYRECARIIRDGVRRMGLRLLLPDELTSNTVTTVFLPERIKLAAFVTELADRGYLVYPGKGPLYGQNAFQIANMGQIEPRHCRALLRVLKETLSDMLSEAQRDLCDTAIPDRGLVAQGGE